MDFITQFPTLLLIFMRVVSFFVVVPIFSHRSVPAMFKIGLAFFLSLTILYTIDVEPLEIDSTYFLLLFKEIITGLAIGLIAYIILSAIQMAGGFIDFQMGFSMANIIDPQTGAQSPIMGQYLYLFSLLFLLSVNGHHLIIDGIFHSYQFIPMDKQLLAFGHENTMEMILKSFGAMFAIAFQMSIPVVGSLFLIDVALGIVARTVPQMNIFVVGFPVKILVSFLMLVIVIGPMIFAVKNLFELLLYSMRDLMTVLGQS
ncbi:flagellar biosynthetic protein FliR [Caldibacillus lycopersici]|uniref:Flagellar biosynthetic protein FliR n=1 Tax=Perspicuibacillus lycopersici TaxID=1325689 RepID=A0AAE3IST7_9BACI|nr:flagellar biosynthetic protein FliR [Perspicuibacillus lycopersici]MCU9612089.1 flagellar biosynthetic protein FliR [Perspicuibacillus lycopersici]